MKSAAAQEHPVAERVQARERDIAGADHQRHHQVEEGRAQRHDDEENHRRAVHREDAVVLVRVEDVAVRRRQLQPHEQRLDAADEEEQERRHAVQDPDALVVDGRQPAPDAVMTATRQARPPQRLSEAGSSRLRIRSPSRYSPLSAATVSSDVESGTALRARAAISRLQASKSSSLCAITVNFMSA